jgi:hypothetical protein
MQLKFNNIIYSQKNDSKKNNIRKQYTQKIHSSVIYSNVRNDLNYSMREKFLDKYQRKSMNCYVAATIIIMSII